MLKKIFSDSDEHSSALVGKQAFLESLQNALVDLAEELKNQLMEITVRHLKEIEDEALIQEMLFSMPGEMLLAALERISGEGKQLSPALTKLMANIARAQDQGVAPDTSGKFDSATREKIQKLLSKERYDEYVPDDYSDILQKISSGLLSTDKTVDFDVEKHLPGLQDERVNRDITIALMTLMNGEIDEQVYADFCARVARGIADLIHAHEYGLLVNVYKTLVHHVSHKEGLAARIAATAAVNAFSQERCIKLLAEAFSARTDSKDSAFEELVMLTGATNLGWLIRQYLQLYSGERGQQLFALLGRFGAQAAEEAVALLPECNDAQAMALLKLIRVTGDNACIVPVRKLLVSDSAELRLEALRTLLKVKDASALPALRKMLYARDLRTVETALKFIQENEVQELAPDLAAMIKTLFISGNSLARNKARLSVLAALCNTKVLPALQAESIGSVLILAPGPAADTALFIQNSSRISPSILLQSSYARGRAPAIPNMRRACQEISIRQTAVQAVTAAMKSTTANRCIIMAETDIQDIVKIITEIVSTVTNMHLYPPTHPQVAPLVDRVYQSIVMILESAPELTLIIVDEDIILYGKPLTNVGPVGKTFVKLLTKKGIERITLLKGLPKEQLFACLNELASVDIKTVASRSCIKVGKVFFDGELDGESDDCDGV